MIPTFCLHHPVLYERKHHCLEIFNFQKMDVDWVEDFYPIEENYKIKKEEISLTKKHIKSLQKQINEKYEYILILEDDIVIPPYLNFTLFTDMCCEELKASGGEILFIGATRDYVVKHTTPNKVIYENANYVSRGTHAYITSLSCSSKLINIKNDYSLPFDHWLNNAIINNKIRTFWSHP